MTKSTTLSKRLVLDKRREERISVTRAVRLGRQTGITRNISTSGVYFETDVDYALGSEIIFAIELDGSADRKLTLRCRGMIVRVEHSSGKVGVAVNIITSQPRVSMRDEPQLIQ